MAGLADADMHLSEVELSDALAAHAKAKGKMPEMDHAALARLPRPVPVHAPAHPQLRGADQPELCRPGGAGEEIIFFLHPCRARRPRRAASGGFRRGFRRQRAASSFAHGGKGTKTPPETAQDERSALIFAHPTPSDPSGHLPLTGGVGPGPHYGGTPSWEVVYHFRRAKSEWPSKLPPGHWALGV